jgi:hypothetical protein
VAGSPWNIAGNGDFFDAGNSDILWCDASGDIAIWQLQGGQVINSYGLGTVSTSWNLLE